MCDGVWVRIRVCIWRRVANSHNKCVIVQLDFLSFSIDFVGLIIAIKFWLDMRRQLILLGLQPGVV